MRRRPTIRLLAIFWRSLCCSLLAAVGELAADEPTVVEQLPRPLVWGPESEPPAAPPAVVFAPWPGEAPARPESLAEAWTIALQVDQQLEAQHFQRAAAEFDLFAARSQRLPLLGLDSAYTLRSNEPGFVFQAPVPGLPITSAVFPYSQAEEFSFQALVRTPLYTSGRISHAIEAAEADELAAALEAEIFAADLKMRVAEEYIAVLWSESDVAVAESNVRSLGGHARDAEAFYECQRKSRNDLLTAQVAFADARQGLLQAQNRLEVARCTYNRRLGRALTAPVWLEPLPVTGAGETVEAATAKALAQRRELDQLAARAAALRHQAESLRGANRPQLELRGGYSFQENRFQSPQGIASAALAATWSPYDGGRARHQADALQRRAEATDRLARDLKSQIVLETRQAWLATQETLHRLEVTQQAIRQAEENLHVARVRYASGVGASAEVLDAELLRVRSHRNHQRAHYDAILAQLRLRRAAGEL